MLAPDIGIHLIIPILQGAGIQDGAFLTWFNVHRFIPPIYGLRNIVRVRSYLLYIVPERFMKKALFGRLAGLGRIISSLKNVYWSTDI